MGLLNTCVNYLANFKILKLCPDKSHELWKPEESTAYCVEEEEFTLGLVISISGDRIINRYTPKPWKILISFFIQSSEP